MYASAMAVTIPLGFCQKSDACLAADGGGSSGDGGGGGNDGEVGGGGSGGGQGNVQLIYFDKDASERFAPIALASSVFTIMHITLQIFEGHTDESRYLSADGMKY
ncbi:hypothetical protein CYMTET_9284 [Cymbomonas tetramitiformis]|uniref:Uncharacterized protein n=1 Tax=Cymbomonas tetramitiformis TaxID=36881 RepID=A0AAE0GRC9_9CHLO|nr:hypothetical protein CYMTET_9284 [Cymbomonas tetramitiformis]